MFPKSLVYAFVATSLFLANGGVEARSGDHTTDKSSTLGNDLKAPSFITISSILSTTHADSGFLGICRLPSTPYDGISDYDGDRSDSHVQKFIDEAKKNAECFWQDPTNVLCKEKGGKEDLDPKDITWWYQTFCKRCSDAGGKNRSEFACVNVDAAPDVKGKGTKSNGGMKRMPRTDDDGLV
ncbi:uncharacterized protein UHO2_05613 [Ustilago hordei]|uniref:uncharacterized protein n=2 Tax=Ustilago hordei TaxID=120017 RepID=UPI001A53F433|nr:uncharacterized protein UHO2_05613 [Ustilago hordei]SYW76896.1 related to Mig2-2 [Ustilago hordei]